jgi:hypothetical protein
MKKLLFFATGLSLALAGIALGAGGVFDSTNFTSDGRKWQPAPSGHTPGKDNGPGEGVHHRGEDCGICHKPGGKAGNKVWTMSGTLYDSRAARTPLAGGEIILQDCEGNVISMTSNELGNFWTTAPIASNPYTVATPHAGGAPVPLYALDSSGQLQTPADPADSRTWRYKAWVKVGDNVMPMVTLAGVGGGDTAPRMSCSMHHAGLGSRGGLWAQAKPTLKSYPSTSLSYKKHIFPILRNKCAPCHIPGSTMTTVMTKTDLETPPTTVNYSSNLDLMTYEGSTVSGATKKGVLSAVNTSAPASSLLLNKTLNGSTHGGGNFWSEQDADYKAILQWIAEGAQKN